MKQRSGSRQLAAAALLVMVCVGCQRGATKISPPGQTTEAKPDENTVKVVRPARESNVVRLRTVRAFREWGVRETAADALARIGDSAVPALIETLHDPDHTIRAQAAVALARMGPKAVAAVPDLIVALNDPDKEVRRGAARALGQIGPDAEQAVPALIEALKDPRNRPAPRPLEIEAEIPIQRAPQKAKPKTIPSETRHPQPPIPSP